MKTSDGSLEYLTFCSPLGWILVAASSKGLCLLHFCGQEPPSDPECLGIIRETYPEAEAERASTNPLLNRVKRALLRYLVDRHPIPPLPLDPEPGTPFQKEVWNALLRIPFGETRSYIEIARGMGRPRAARAVGQACGKNPVAVIVPCHRVAASGGKLGGYGGGLHLKKKLLKLERRKS